MYREEICNRFPLYREHHSKDENTISLISAIYQAEIKLNKSKHTHFKSENNPWMWSLFLFQKWCFILRFWTELNRTIVKNNNSTAIRLYIYKKNKEIQEPNLPINVPGINYILMVIENSKTMLRSMVLW